MDRHSQIMTYATQHTKFKAKRRFERFYEVTIILIAIALTGCGGGGGGGGGNANSGGGSSPPPPSVAPAPPAEPTITTVSLIGETGEPLVGDQNLEYTKADAIIRVYGINSRLFVEVEGDENWVGTFQLPEPLTLLEPGTYSGLTELQNFDPAIGGIEWVGESVACTTITGQVVIDEVAYRGTFMTDIRMSFELTCDNASGVLRGEVYWFEGDDTMPPGPTVPIPESLWSADPNDVPTSGNYIYLQSESGDFVGGGGTYTFLDTDVLINNSNYSRYLFFAVRQSNDLRWDGTFEAMNVVREIEVGYYPGTQRHGYHNRTKGGLDWSGEGRSCTDSNGWFAVDHIAFQDTWLTEFEARFEQQCDSSTEPLRGQIRWYRDDAVSPAGPERPIPADLWAPDPGEIPATGNYVYLESETGDLIGQGGRYLYTPLDSRVWVQLSDQVGDADILSLTLEADEHWIGTFQPMVSRPRPEVGFYPNVSGRSAPSRLFGGIDWNTPESICFTADGWVAVDSITFRGSDLASIEMRFAQRCNNDAPALLGSIRWSDEDLREPPGPVVIPPDLRDAPSGSTPTTGSYLYLESGPGERMAGGETLLYTKANSVMSMSALTRLDVSVDGDESWDGEFQAMYSLDQFDVGYYADLVGYPRYNPARGTLFWTTRQEDCPKLTGWFAVDEITLLDNQGRLTSMEGRFAQRCEGDTGSLFGKFRWDAADPTVPPGPQNPPPADLWSPDPAVIPANGDFVYTESDNGDPVGRGETFLYTRDNAEVSLRMLRNQVTVTVRSDLPWDGDFVSMVGFDELVPGYYSDLGKNQLNKFNPAKGALDWTGRQRYCEQLSGWYVVDAIAYGPNGVESIDVRFEQTCEGADGSTRGQIRWTSD